MKKYFSILCMLMLALSFNACSSSDDDHSSWIVGEWYGTEYNKEGNYTLTVSAKFKDTGKVTIYESGSIYSNGRYEYVNDEIKADYVVNNDNTITFTWKNEDGEKETKKYDYEYEEDGDEAELELTNKYTRISLKKVIKKDSKDDDDDDDNNRGGLF